MSDFEMIAKQWKPLLHKFASWDVKGTDYDDRYQELLITLWQATLKHDPAQSALSTYLHRAFSNRLNKLNNHFNKRLKRVPSVVCDPLDDRLVGPREAGELGLSELLANVSPEAYKVGLYLAGESDQKPTQRLLKRGEIELRRLLQHEEVG